MKNNFGVTLIFLMVVLLMAADGKPQRSPPPKDCSGEYPPYCTCREVYARFLTCKVSTDQEFNDIRNKLSNASKKDFSIVNFVMTTTLDIPKDVFGAIKISTLELYCSDRSKPLGQVHAEAFKSIQSYTKRLEIKDCDLTKTSFAFLSQLSVLEQLQMTSCSIKEVLDMPHLPQLAEFSLLQSTNFEKWYTSSQTPNLESIYLNGLNLDDKKIDSILSAMTTGNFIFPKLYRLSMYQNQITRVPPLVSIFPALSVLNLGGNPIKTLPTGSVQKGSTQLASLTLSETGLKTIEPGAFVGDFSSTWIELNNNPSMTSFPSAVFKHLLKSMVNRDGSVNIEKNPIALDCSLNWLLVDNRDLLPYVRYGAIANGTLFKDLNPQQLHHC